jgi:hypothetical protein
MVAWNKKKSFVMSKSNNNIDTAWNKKKSFVMSKSNNNIDTALSSVSETEGVNFGDDSNGGGSTSNMKGYRVETTDLQTAEYLLRLLLSHEQYGTEAPEWLVSSDYHNSNCTLSKREYMKNKLIALYRNGRKTRAFQYHQKNDSDGDYGSWILKKPAYYLTSAHAMKRELRANLFHRNYLDVDIVNAFPSLLLGLVESLKFHPDEYKNLKQNVTQRKEVLEKIQNERSCNKRKAKKNLLSIMFKNPENKFKNLSTFEKDSEREIGVIAKKLSMYKGIDWVKRSKKGHLGAALSLLLQTMCASCLKYGVSELQNQNCKVDALIFDGCLVEKSDRVEAAIEKLNRSIVDVPEFKFVKFSIKAFEDIIDTSRELPVKFIRDGFNDNSTHHLPLQWNEILPQPEVEFDEYREWMEYKNALVNRLNSRFAMASQGTSFQTTVILEKITSTVDTFTKEPCFPGYRYVFKSIKDAFAFYKNKTITVTIKNLIGKSDRPYGFRKNGVGTFSLLSELWNHGPRLSYSIMDYNPVPLGTKGCVNRDTFNWFYGYRISRERAEKAVAKGGKPDIIKDFVKNLLNDDKDVISFVFSWMAFLLQNPSAIPGVMLALQGPKGIGKSLLYVILKLILGEMNCTSISDVDHLLGTFNDKRKDKKLVALEEIGSSVYDPKSWGKLKDMITNSTQGFNGKHKAITDSNSPTGFIQFTNDEDFVRVDTDGVRRVYAIKCNRYWSYGECVVQGRTAEREKKFSNLVRQVSLDENGCLSAFAYFLYTYPLKMDAGRFVRLEHYNAKCPALHEQTMRSLTVPAQMVVSWVEGACVWTEITYETIDRFQKTEVIKEHFLINDTHIWVPRERVYCEYSRLYKEQKRGKPMSEQNFWTELRKYIKLGQRSDKSIGGRRYRGVVFPSKQKILKTFMAVVPGYSFNVDCHY